MPMRYVGRYPDTEGSVSPHIYADAANSKTKLTTDIVNAAVDTQVSALATTAYVDQQDATKAAKSAVTAADNNYIPLTGHGLAVLDSTGAVAASQIPSVTSQVRPSLSFTGIVGSGTVASAGLRSLSLGTITIPDPGFPYVVLAFAWVNGSDPNGTVKSRWAGTGNTGKLVVMPSGSDAIHAWGVCAGSAKSSAYPVTPAVSMGAGSQKLTGSTTLNLYGSVMVEAVGQSYTFSGGSFFVNVLPAA